MNILFVGNSFTFYNKMPYMVSHMINNEKEKLNIEVLAYGGCRLSDYLNKRWKIGREFFEKIKEKKWDFIVLQEQSVAPYKSKEKFYDAVENLNREILLSGAKTVLYQTWSYQYCSKELISLGISHEELHNTLRSAYLEIAKKINAIVVPVGDYFYYSQLKYPTINLFKEDGIHPSINGSYLAAYLFFRQFFPDKEASQYTVDGMNKKDFLLIRNMILKCDEERNKIWKK